MQAIDDTIAILGRPVLARALGTTPGAAIARWQHGPRVVDVPPSSTIRLAMSLVDGRNAQSHGMAADRTGGASVSIFSPTEGISIQVKGEADVVQLFLDLSCAEAALDQALVCPPMFNLQDDAMRAMLMRILVGSSRREADDVLAVEQDLHALTLHIARHAHGSKNRGKPPAELFRGGLAPAAFRRVEALVEVALDRAGSPGLADMAGAAGLSVTHFVRAFRWHTGSTPHKYLVRRRIQRAVSFLRTPQVPVADVADKAGFSTPAHFVATFRETMGVTPAALRDALLG